MQTLSVNNSFYPKKYSIWVEFGGGVENVVSSGSVVRYQRFRMGLPTISSWQRPRPAAPSSTLAHPTAPVPRSTPKTGSTDKAELLILQSCQKYLTPIVAFCGFFQHSPNFLIPQFNFSSCNGRSCPMAVVISPRVTGVRHSL